MKKVVKAFSNKQSDDYCLQSCVQSILDYYFKDRSFSELEINLNTQYHTGHFSWSYSSVVWFDKLGLDVKLYIPVFFDFERFTKDGLKYLQKIVPPDGFNMMLKRGDYTYISDIQRSAQEIIQSKLLINSSLEVNELEGILDNESSLAIGKTMHQWLDNKDIIGTNHYVVIVKKYSPGKWLIQDPGLPFRPNRKVNQLINGHSMFPADLIVIYGTK